MQALCNSIQCSSPAMFQPDMLKFQPWLAHVRAETLPTGMSYRDVRQAVMQQCPLTGEDPEQAANEMLPADAPALHLQPLRIGVLVSARAAHRPSFA